MNQETQSQIAQDIHMFRTIAAVIFALLVVSATFFHTVEKWDWLDSVYFTVVTMATVGYGDFTPHTDAGKIGAMVLIVIGIGLFGTFASLLIKRQTQIRQAKKQKQD
jgi:voltage-gated potassium channel Kch